MSGTISDNIGRSTGLIKSAAGGGILQVKSVTKTDTETIGQFASPQTQRVDVSDLELDITPASTANKILASFTINAGDGRDGGCQIECDSTGSYAIINPPVSFDSRSPTHSGGHSRSEYELQAWTVQVLHDPGVASSINYKITCNGAAGGYVYINRSKGDQDDPNGERSVSSLTLMEVASTAL